MSRKYPKQQMVYLTDEMFEEVRKTAEDNERSMAGEIRFAIKLYLAAHYEEYMGSPPLTNEDGPGS